MYVHIYALREASRFQQPPYINACLVQYFRLYFWTFAQKLKVKKLELKHKKLKTQEFFAQNSKLWQFFQILNKIFDQI